jgi:transposase
VKTIRSQKLRMLLMHRKLLQSKAIAIDNDLRGTLRNFGLKVRNPRQSGQRFRRKAATHSDPKRPPIPIEGGHPVDGVNRGPLSAF